MIPDYYRHCRYYYNYYHYYYYYYYHYYYTCFVPYLRGKSGAYKSGT